MNFVGSIYKMSFKYKIFFTVLLCCFIGSVIFVFNNHSFYERPIAKVVKTTIEDVTEVNGINGNEDKLYTQHIIAELINGEDKGKEIHLTNEYSQSKAYDHEFENGNELFIKIDEHLVDSAELTGTILDVKRDKYLLLAGWVFIFVLLIVGKKQGLFSFISLAINAVILSYALDIYIHTSNQSLLWI